MHTKTFELLKLLPTAITIVIFYYAATYTRA